MESYSSNTLENASVTEISGAAQSGFFDVILRFSVNLDCPPAIYPNAPTDEVNDRVMRFLNRQLNIALDGEQ